MASYRATGPTSYDRRDGGSGVGVKVLALFLGIAVGVLVIVAAVLIKIADDARDDVNATATAAPAAHDHSAPAATSAVSLPLQSYAGVTGDTQRRSPRRTSQPTPRCRRSPPASS